MNGVSPTVFSESVQLPSAAPAPPGQFQSPTQVTAVVKKLTLCNSSTTNGYIVTIHIVPSGGAVALGNLLIYQRAIGPKQTIDVTEAMGQILAGGDCISAFADVADKVNIRISGVLMT